MRSRLEARWATFFTHCGLKWSYEPKTFSLPSGQSYTPDFHVDGVGWFEIKPSDDKCYEGRAKIVEFCRSAEKLLHSETEKSYFVTIGNRPSLASVHLGYSSNVKTTANLAHCFWKGSQAKVISFPDFQKVIIPNAERAAAEFRQHAVLLGEAVFAWRNKECGVPFRALSKDWIRREKLPFTINELKRGSSSRFR